MMQAVRDAFEAAARDPRRTVMRAVVREADRPSGHIEKRAPGRTDGVARRASPQT